MPGMKGRTAAAALNHLRRPAIIGSFLVLPFVILEFVNTGPFPDLAHAFPIPLFALMWLLAFSFVWQLSFGAAMIVRGLPFVRRVIAEIDAGAPPKDSEPACSV